MRANARARPCSKPGQSHDTHAHTHVHARTRTHAHARAHTQTRTHARVHARAHARTRTRRAGRRRGKEQGGGAACTPEFSPEFSGYTNRDGRPGRPRRLISSVIPGTPGDRDSEPAPQPTHQPESFTPAVSVLVYKQFCSLAPQGHRPAAPMVRVCFCTRPRLPRFNLNARPPSQFSPRLTWQPEDPGPGLPQGPSLPPGRIVWRAVREGPRLGGPASGRVPLRVGRGARRRLVGLLVAAGMRHPRAPEFFQNASPEHS